MKITDRYEDYIPPGQLLILLAACDQVTREGRTTIRDIQATCGYASPNSVAPQLNRLRQKGLINNAPSLCGAIRPTVRFIPADQLGTE